MSGKPRVQTAQTDQIFAEFVRTVEPKLAYALAMAYGPETGREATCDALAYAWENWVRVSAMENPAGYLYRVGQSSARRYRRRFVQLPPVSHDALPHVEPGLPRALRALTVKQRIAVVLIHGQGYTDVEAAQVMGLTRGTARKHAERGLAKLRAALKVRSDG
jgi:RNA polymerase sigma-70 factor (ECF subfamily)